MRPVLLGDRGEAAHVGEHDGGFLARTAEQVRPAAFQHLRRDGGVHVARHGRLHALLGADVLEHQHGAELFRAVRCTQRHDADIDRAADAAQRQLGVREVAGLAGGLGGGDVLSQPVSGVLEQFGQRSADERVFLALPDAQPCSVTGDDLAGRVERHHRVRHAVQDAVVVALHPLHVVEQLRVL